MGNDNDYLERSKAADAIGVQISEVGEPFGGLLPEISKLKVLAVSGTVIGVNILEWVGVVSPEHAVGVTALAAALASASVDLYENTTGQYDNDFAMATWVFVKGTAWGTVGAVVTTLANEPHINKLLVDAYEVGLPATAKAIKEAMDSPAGQAMGENLKKLAGGSLEFIYDRTGAVVDWTWNGVVDVVGGTGNGFEGNKNIRDIISFTKAAMIVGGVMGAVYLFLEKIGGGTDQNQDITSE